MWRLSRLAAFALLLSSLSASADGVSSGITVGGTDGISSGLTIGGAGISNGGSGSSSTPTAAPTVTSVSPGSGPIAGGTTVTIVGTQFIGLSGAAAVKFGLTNATSYIVLSSTSISAVSPAHVAATIDVTVTNPIGTSATSPADSFTYSTSPSCGTLDLSTGCAQLVAFGGLF